MENEERYLLSLPFSDVLALNIHLKDTRPGTELDTFIAELVRRWLMIDKERLAIRRDGPAMRGFQWKNLFLPEGTHLRTTYHHTVEFAKVEGDYILSDDGISLTPSQFANRHAQGRNAWRFIWLRFPGNDYWVRASDCRQRTKPV
jgi:hypothetical protein